ncbi:hypothetical protein [Haloactinopolyspora sp.]|uniref:hypothetical protein n=1 Tax=Haloactinopolyspora sp. TaxID=1966353 RepID=UPI00262E42CC|nr:hypothetical protein [Haloactinopolyspora sp.]
MEIPRVTADHVRHLRKYAPHADLVYVGSGRLEVDGQHNDVVHGTYLCSSSMLDDLPAGIDDEDAAARLTASLAADLDELATKEHAEAFVRRLNEYQGADIWAEIIEADADFDEQVPYDYPAYVRSEYDRRQYEANATVAEFVGLGGRATFYRSRRDNVWHVEYTS